MTSYVGSGATAWPYKAVVYVQASFPNGMSYTGSGAVVGPNDVLTAAHLVYSAADGGTATSVQVTPARDGGSQPFGSFSAQTWNYFPVDQDGDGFLFQSDSEVDLAILGFEQRLGDQTGWFGLSPNSVSGIYELTGYPAVYADGSGPRMTTDTGWATDDRSYSVLEYIGIESNPGNSGGPLWQWDDGAATIFGVASTSGWATDLETKYSTVLSWISGNDTLWSASATQSTGTDGPDMLVGTAGNDIISAGDGWDTVDGGIGDDIIYGNRNLDSLSGGSGADTLYGGQNDGPATADASGLMAMQQGTETIRGGVGNDYIYGNFGSDILYGDDGDDALYGGQNPDSLFGGAGNDWLFGNRGSDELSGGDGADVFVIASNGGQDVITDMTHDGVIDKVYIQRGINGASIYSVEDILGRLSNDGSGRAVVDLGDGNSVTFSNHAANWFTGADFVLF
jgi:Ca2+-binding RTX toxin-like protein